MVFEEYAELAAGLPRCEARLLGDSGRQKKGEVLLKGGAHSTLLFSTSVEALLVKFPSAQWQLVF